MLQSCDLIFKTFLLQDDEDEDDDDDDDYDIYYNNLQVHLATSSCKYKM